MATNKRLIKSNDEGGGGPSFNTVLYTGTGATNPVTGVGFQPDLVWIKNRTNTNSNVLQDSIRGANQYLISNTTNAEATRTDFQSFDSNGFTVTGNNDSWNGSHDYVAWNFKAGGAAVTNTDGTITSQVSANTEAGFSIVGWQSSGSVATVGHGLGVAPDIIIAKKRDSAGAWNVYSSEIGNTVRLRLNETNAAETNSVWGNTTPTNSVFTQDVTSGTTNVIAYCFAEVEGFSNFGSYVGTGAAGNFQDCGFEPAFVMLKRSNGSGGWFIYDNKRASNLYLQANSSSSEGSDGGVVFNSNGFTINVTYQDHNALLGEYIYMAFADQF